MPPLMSVEEVERPDENHLGASERFGTRLIISSKRGGMFPEPVQEYHDAARASLRRAGRGFARLFDGVLSLASRSG